MNTLFRIENDIDHEGGLVEVLMFEIFELENYHLLDEIEMRTGIKFSDKDDYNSIHEILKQLYGDMKCVWLADESVVKKYYSCKGENLVSEYNIDKMRIVVDIGDEKLFTINNKYRLCDQIINKYIYYK